MIDRSRLRKNFMEGVKAPFTSWKRTTGTVLASFIAFSVSILSTNPEYSIQMISSGLKYWPTAFQIRTLGLLTTTGLTGLFLTIIFSVLVGMTITNTLVQLRMSKLSTDTLGALPGFLAGGCASCGVGVLSVLGLSGVLASLPFHGNLLKLGGVMLLLVLITRTGNPETCSV